MNYSEASEFSSDSDEDYEPPEVINARDSLMLFGNGMLTRSMRMYMLDRMG